MGSLDDGADSTQLDPSISYRDAHGGLWEHTDINGWVVDGQATVGGHDPDGHGPFTVARDAGQLPTGVSKVYAAGGQVPAGSAIPAPIGPHCDYRIPRNRVRGWPKTAAAAQATWDDMVRRRGREQTDAEKAALEAMQLMAQRQRQADLDAEEHRIRGELKIRVQRELEHTVDHGDFGDASGHLGGDGFAALAEAAVDAFAEYYRDSQAGRR